MPTNRFNEGKCDRRGRFWAGTMDDRLKDHSAALFRVDPDLSVTKVLDGIGISNSIVWSLDDTANSTSPTRSTASSTASISMRTAATIANRRRIVDLKGTGIGPDGSTIDTEGYLWNAQWDGWRVARYAPDGRLDRVVDASGPETDELHVRRSRPPAPLRHLGDLGPHAGAARGAQPLAGGLFALDVGIGGVPEPLRGLGIAPEGCRSEMIGDCREFEAVLSRNHHKSGETGRGWLSSAP